MSISKLAQWRLIETQDEILKKDLLQNDEKLKDIFSSSMEFGTAGIRGVMGAGTNKMNVLTVAAAADAYAKYLLENVKDATKNGIVIGHDNRHNSALFAETVANVLINNGIKSFLFHGNELQPTPLVSFVIREMKLAGGAIITASHNPKEYNGFKVYDSFGGQLMPSETKKIQELMKGIDPLHVKRTQSNKVLYIQQEIVEKYVSEVLKVKLRDDAGCIKVVFSPYHGTSAKLGPKLLEQMGIDYDVVNSQMSPDPNFSKIKTANPEDEKSYFKALNKARRVKADLIITTDPDADRLGVVVKYQRRYKFLNGNQTAALYLDYMLTQMKQNGKIPKNGYIVKSNVSGDLAAKIAQKFGLKVYEVHVGFKNIANLIEEKKGENFVFGYEESYGFLINPDISRDKDSLQAMVGVVEMVNYYKSKNVNTYEHLKEMYKTFGIHRTEIESRKLDKIQTSKLLSKMSKLSNKSKIGDRKVLSVEDYRDGFGGLGKSDLVKVNLEGGSWFAVRPSGTEPKVKIYVQTVGDSKQQLIDIVAYEREIGEWIQDNTEEFEDKHWSWKAFLKYAIFIAIVIGVMAFVFNVVYKTATSSGENVKIFTVAQAVADKSARWVWLALWIWVLIQKVISAWMQKRMFQRLKINVPLKHIVFSQMMSGIIGFITPFAVGGDAVGYWYLRRKGVQRAPLIATLMSSTLWSEIKFALQTLVLVGIGWQLYQHIFNTGDIQAHAALIWFFIGLSWSYFAAFMILMLTTNRRMQEFIVRNSVKFLEWMPIIHISDPSRIAAGIQYEFKMTRAGMRKIWNKWWFILEMAFYDLLPLFFSPFAFIRMTNGTISPDVPAGPYWAQIVSGDIIGTANSMSLTPGGSGTNEWLNIVINKTIYDGTDLSSKFTTESIASGLDFQYKLFYGWPDLLLSSVLILFATLFVRKKPFAIFNTRAKRAIFVSSICSLFTVAVALMIFLI